MVNLAVNLRGTAPQDDGLLWGDPLSGPLERLELPEVREVQISAGGGESEP